MDKEKLYKVVITKPALHNYQVRILTYLFENFSVKRAAEIGDSILNTASTLSRKPARGRYENYLSSFKEDFRFILFKETRNFELKIVYFISEADSIVYITDFFPTKMNPIKLIE